MNGMQRTLPATWSLSALSPRWPAFALLPAFAAPILLWLGRDLTFTWDECVWIARGSDLFAPHNEHWSTVPLLAWKTLQAGFGTGSYLPFLVLLVASYVAMCAAVYAMLRGLFAVGAVALLLFLGSGSDNLFQAVNIAFLFAIGSGVAAMWFTERRQYPAAAALLLVSVASSGMGIPFVAATLVLAAFQRDRGALWLAAPIIVYAVWFTMYGTTTEPVVISRVPGFVAQQLVGSLGGLIVVPALALIAVPFAVRSRDPLILACIVGAIAEFALIGLVRDEGGSRYQTAFAVFALLAAGRIAWPRFMRPLGYMALALALTVNVAGMLGYQYEFALWLPNHSCSAMGIPL